MASEIRVDKITSLSGVGTITPSPTGIEISGITTVATLKATTGIVTTLTATTGIVTTLTANTVTSLGDVSIADKIVHTGDTDTAIRFSAADTIQLETGGAARLILSGGNILQQSGTFFIKNATGDSNGLKLSQESSDESRIFNHYTGPLTFGTNNTERLRITSAGQLLHRHSASIGLGRDFETSSTSGYGGIAINRFSADTGSGGLDFVKSRNASLGGNTIVQSGDNIGAITWRGADGTDFETPAAQIKVAVDATPGANDMPGRMMFYTTADGASSVSERMRITSSGVLLVGTLSLIHI